MADVDKLNIDSIIQRLLEGKMELLPMNKCYINVLTLTWHNRLVLAYVYQQLGKTISPVSSLMFSLRIRAVFM